MNEVNTLIQANVYIYCMDDIKDVYKTATRAPQGGVEGYYLVNKYFDARKSREEKQLATSKQRTKPLNPSPKSTYIDQLQKQASKLPGPTSYQPHLYQRKSLSNLKADSPPRITFFDEIQKYQKKLNIPAAGTYDKIETKPNDKVKPKSDMSKAQVCSFLECSMRKSIEIPGVGDYNPKIQVFAKKGGIKWRDGKKGEKKRSESERGIKAPQMCTYNPVPVEFDLFDSMSSRKEKPKSYFNREQRFKSDKAKAVPFYNIGSEWGMKSNIKKKDILSRVGSSLTHHSIYY